MKYLILLTLVGCNTFDQAYVECVDDMIKGKDNITVPVKFVCHHSKNFGLCYQTVIIQNDSTILNCIKGKME